MTPPIINGTNGLPCLELTHDSGSFAHVYLHGAQVTSWIPVGRRDVLYLSRLAKFEAGAGIRGGIPVVFPQFADNGPLPKHGWLRKTEWKVDGPEAADDRTSARLYTEDDESSRKIWPHNYRAELDVTLTDSSLTVGLTIHNTGRDSFSFTAALHSYFSVGDVREVSVSGLTGAEYLDKTDSFARKGDDDPALGVDRETDRVYVGAPAHVVLEDHASGTSLGIAATGFPDLVAWNPWAGGMAQLPDMPPDDYLRMICIEPALAVAPFTLAPGSLWAGAQHLTVVG